MDVRGDIARPEPNWHWRIGCWLAITIAFTSWSIQYSFEHGRLIGESRLDDVCYFCDGLDRREELYSHGWGGLARSFIDNPPHTPFSAALAAASFGLFGVHDWAPYAGNGLIIFMLIGFTEWLLLGAKHWVRIVGLAVVLTIPLTQKAVTEFRPDVAVALLTAMGVVMVVSRSLVTANIRYQFLVGLVFAAALLVKPTMCVLTIFLWGLSVGVALLSDWYLHRPTLRKLLGTYALTGLVTVALATPYYVLKGKYIAEYIYRNIFGSEAAIWQIQATPQEHMLYYLTGPGAVEMIDNSMWILAALILAGLVYVLVRRDKENLVRMAALAVCMAGAYAVPTISACKHGFYGLAFFSLGMFAAIMSLREIYRNDMPMRLVWRWGTTVGLLMAGAATLWQDPHAEVWGFRGDANIGSTRQTCDEILSVLVANKQDGKPLVLTTTECREASYSTLEWVARKNGRQFTFFRPRLGSDLAVYRKCMKDADFVLAIETERPNMQFTSERMASEILALARSMPHLVELQSFPACDGVTYYLFKNAHSDFSGWKTFKGLGPVEGPFPEWSLPRVRWGLGSQTQLNFSVKEDRPMRLSMSCRSGPVDQALTVLLDGKEIYSKALSASAAFTSIDVPLGVTTRGDHELTLRYKTSDSAAESRALSLLFERLQILPVAADAAATNEAKGVPANFTGWKTIKGLGPVEGPFSKLDLPQVRWGLGNQTQLGFGVTVDRPMRLSMSCRSSSPDQKLTVLLDGKEIYSKALPANAAFTTIEVPLGVTSKGEHALTLRYSTSDSAAESRALSLLFERLQILPVVDAVAVKSESKSVPADFSGWNTFKGLGPVEGPFPKLNLPCVRWGLGNQTQLGFDVQEDRPMRLSMSCRSSAADQTLTVLLDGKEIYSKALPANAAFTAIEVPLGVTSKGEHALTLRYSTSDSAAESRALSLLFERLQILPVADNAAAAKNEKVTP